MIPYEEKRMYYIRADGSAAAGAGHLMRCLTIADELQRLPEATGRIRFLCADDASAAFVREKGYEALVLHTDQHRMEEELPVLEELPDMHKVQPVFLVDSYYVTDSYLKGLSRHGRVFLLDDMGDHAYPVDGVINYNAFACAQHYRQLYAESRTCCYVGSRYVPVRPQFLEHSYTVREQVREVLITTGGGDRENIAAQVLKAVRKEHCRYHVVVGRFSPHFAFWKQLEQQSSRLCVHHDVKDMAALMCRCDLAVTAGGTTIYELAAAGVPFLCFSYAENQEALTEYVGREKIAGYCGAWHLDSRGMLARMRALAEEACMDRALRIRMHERERQMTDGLGAGRIAALLAHGGEEQAGPGTERQKE